jgi:site-specific DNA-cytosine methylase
MLKHIVEPEINKKDFDITERMRKKKPGTLAYEKAWKNVRSLNEKSKTLLTRQDISNSGATNIKYSDNKYYKPTPIEAERLQTLPDNYTAVGVIDGKEIPISNTQRYKMIGNGWTVDVIAHILSFIPETYLHTVVGLFDGISCGQVALKRAGKVYNQYYASEIDKYTIAVTQKNYPHTIQLGDVTKIDWNAFLEGLDLI